MSFQAILAAAILAVGLSLGVTVEHWRSGNIIRDLKLEISDLEILAVKESRAKEREKQKASDAIAGELIAEMEAEKAAADSVTVEVIRYVQSDSDKCALADEWVRIHDQAASGGLSTDAGATTRNDDSSEGVTDDKALITVTDNLQACREYIVRLKWWQEWYKGVASEN